VITVRVLSGQLHLPDHVGFWLEVCLRRLPSPARTGSFRMLTIHQRMSQMGLTTPSAVRSTKPRYSFSIAQSGRSALGPRRPLGLCHRTSQMRATRPIPTSRSPQTAVSLPALVDPVLFDLHLAVPPSRESL